MKGNRKQKVRDKAKRLQKLRERGINVQMQSAGDVSFLREVDYIAQRAAERDARCISLGVLLFFSTDTGDAWMLDTEDGFALCLARDGEAQPVRIMETETKSAIEWDRDYIIDGDRFTTIERKTGRVTTIIGYPTEAILAMMEVVKEMKG